MLKGKNECMCFRVLICIIDIKFKGRWPWILKLPPWSTRWDYETHMMITHQLLIFSNDFKFMLTCRISFPFPPHFQHRGGHLSQGYRHSTGRIGLPLVFNLVKIKKNLWTGARYIAMIDISYERSRSWWIWDKVVPSSYHLNASWGPFHIWGTIAVLHCHLKH